MKKTLLSIALLAGFTITSFGQIIVEDITPGAGHSFAYQFTELNNNLYFSARINDTAEIWKFDGTTVTRIDDGNSDPAKIPTYFDVFNGKILYTYANQSNGSTEGLYEYDGINAPTLVANLNANGPDGDNRPGIVFNGKYYFCGNDGTNGYELFEYDGTNTPTMVVDLNTIGSGGYPTSFTIFQNKLFFVASDGIAGSHLYSYDGTNPVVLVDSNVMTSNTWGLPFPEINGKLYLAKYADIQDYQSGTIFEFDGTNPPTPVTSSVGTGQTHYATGVLSTYYGVLYFEVTEAGTGAGGRFQYDFTNPATALDPDIKGLEWSGIPVGNDYYFTKYDVTYGSEIGHYDGTTSTTLTDINTSGNSVYDSPVYFQGKLYFCATDGNTGYELWEMDPNSVGINNFQLPEISIFPNPTTDWINISTDATIESIEIFNLNGQLLLNDTGNQINIESLSQGVYIIKTSTDKGINIQQVVKN